MFIPVMSLLLQDTCVDLALDLALSFFESQTDNNADNDDFNHFPKPPSLDWTEKKFEYWLETGLLLLCIASSILVCVAVKKYIELRRCSQMIGIDGGMRPLTDLELSRIDDLPPPPPSTPAVARNTNPFEASLEEQVFEPREPSLVVESEGGNDSFPTPPPSPSLPPPPSPPSVEADHEGVEADHAGEDEESAVQAALLSTDL